MAMLGAQPAQALTNILQNPPQLPLRQETTSYTALPSQAKVLGQGKTLKEFDLSIEYINSRIRNPGERRIDQVRLRGYVGTNTSEDTPFVAPTIEVNPGDTVRVNLKNNLPIVPNCKVSPEKINEPHCFNGTNLHTHGLWISPTGNSDNVLLSINPGEEFQYEFNIPPEHPAGTFWYHPHRHGSTALQVASGMAGALIVHGDRKPEADGINQFTHGDIDTLLAGLTDMPERILVLQQIQYACLDDEGEIKVRKDLAGNVVAWVCDDEDTGGIEFYDSPGGNGLFGPGTWDKSGRHTSINGKIIPIIRGDGAHIPRVKAGQIERWRAIHAGVRDTISLEFRKSQRPVKGSIRYVKASEQDDWIQKY
ncbi:MAG: multicopper oxidase domain-containing protein [Symploca sp. SIO3E6]|nr:multicopper oxidase domain-containing protein [Caldora sp. SIO3E6]